MAARSAHWLLLKAAWSWGMLASAAQADTQGFAAIDPLPLSAAWSWRATLAFGQSCAFGDATEGEGAAAAAPCC